MKCSKLVAIITTLATVFGATAIIYEYNRYSNGILNFLVNGQRIPCKNISEVKGYIEDNTSTYLDKLDITSCASLEADTTKIENLSFLDYIKLENKDITIDTSIVTIDIDELRDTITKFNLNQNISTDAKIIDNGEIYNIQPEVIGEQIDTERIIKDLLDDKVSILDISFEDYKIQPEITENDLEKLVEDANKYVTWTVTYDSGQQFTCGLQNVKINGDNIEVDDSFIKDIVKELEKVYDTAGNGFIFTDINSNTSTIYGGTFGNIMSSADEREYLTNLFEKLTSEYNRKPIMKQETQTEIGDTYLEISIQEQHMWHFVDGELCCETDVVTGDANKRRDTPTGVYFISERINGKYLTGADYKTWVNKWMRLTNTGIGLHDAGWRGRFGGTIYKGNGSHGCINLPKTYAYNLFEEVYNKMPVIIY